jgi:hypothetical protein
VGFKALGLSISRYFYSTLPTHRVYNYKNFIRFVIDADKFSANEMPSTVSKSTAAIIGLSETIFVYSSDTENF